MTFSIYFEREGYTTSIDKLMGRNAAGESFLQGLFRYSSTDHFSCVVKKKEEAAFFDSQCDSYRQNASKTSILTTQIGALAERAGLYYPGPNIAEHSFHRLSCSRHHDAWALCGITHTTSSALAMDAIASWITAPVQQWDSVICTSTAVKKNVEVILQAQVDSLEERLGITKIRLPQLPVIPLGIHTKDFDYSSAQRIQARKTLNVDDETLVVLYAGRLSFHAKAHPLAMYQAIEDAAQVTGKKVLLIECGWHANEYIEKAFDSAAKMASPSVKVVTLDGRSAENRNTAWAGADIFCSLSDNIQESFGIVPLEAMAAGLPVVVSDWDGYRDTVRDGIDGFRIPTLAPAPGMAGDLAHRHALEIDTYDIYCGHSSSLVAVNVKKIGQAFIELFQSPELRKKMGAAGRLRVTQDFDWRTIIPQYEDLWAKQTEIRLAAQKARFADGKSDKTVATSVWPARLDPTIAFANYPTQHLTLATELMLAEPSADRALTKLADYKELAMVNYAHFIFPSDEEIKSVFEAAEAHLPNGSTAEALLADIEVARQPYVLRGLAWLCKLGLFQFS